MRDEPIGLADSIKIHVATGHVVCVGKNCDQQQQQQKRRILFLCCVLQPSPSTSVYMRAVATANMTVNTSHRDMVLMNQGRRARDIILCGWLLCAAIFFFLGSFSLFGGVVVGVHSAHCTSAQNATRLTKMTGAGFTIFVVVHSLACQR